MKNIAFFTNFYDYPKQKIISSFENVFPKDIKMYFLCPESHIDKFELKRAEAVKLSNPLELRKICRELNINVLTNIGGSDKMAIVLILSTIFTDTKIIFHLRGNIFPKKMNGFKFKIICLINNIRHISFFVFQFFFYRFFSASKDITNKLRRIFFLSRNKIFFVPNTIETDLFKPKDKFLCRKKLGLNKEDHIIIYVGRVHYLKGSDLLFKIIKRNRNKKFIIVGELMDKNFNVNLDNIIYHEYKTPEELVDYYNASDLCLFLSRIEGYGRVPREAMACGTPTIVSDIEALNEINCAEKKKNEK